MRRTEHDRWWHLGGVVVGLLVTVAAVHDPVTAAPATSGTDVRMTAAPTGELDIAPRGAFLIAEALPASGHLSVTNQTGVTLSVTANITSTATGFADRLHLRIRAGSETVADGTLQSLVTGSQPWLLQSGVKVDVTVEARWAQTEDGNHADAVHIDMHFETERGNL